MTALTDVSIYAFADDELEYLRDMVRQHDISIMHGFLSTYRDYIVAKRDTSDVGSAYNAWLWRKEEDGELLYGCDNCNDEGAGKSEELPEGWRFDEIPEDVPSWEYPDVPPCMCEYCFDGEVENLIELIEEEGRVINSVHHLWDIWHHEWWNDVAPSVLREAAIRLGLWEEDDDEEATQSVV